MQLEEDKTRAAVGRHLAKVEITSRGSIARVEKVLEQMDTTSRVLTEFHMEVKLTAHFPEKYNRKIYNYKTKINYLFLINKS